MLMSHLPFEFLASTVDDIETWTTISKIERFHASNAKSKKDFMRLYVTHKQHQRTQQEYERKLHEDQEHERQLETAVICMLLSFVGRPWEFVLFLCVVLLSIFIPLKADGIITWNWVYIFIPLYIIMFQVCVYSFRQLFIDRQMWDIYSQRLLVFVADIALPDRLYVSTPETLQ
jgi:hypothetical protein